MFFFVFFCALLGRDFQAQIKTIPPRNAKLQNKKVTNEKIKTK